MIRRERWSRNRMDSHNKNTLYELEKFGTKRREDFRMPMCEDVTKPSNLLGVFIGSHNIPTLLDPYYKVEELRTLRALANREKINKKDFDCKQKVFSPNILTYMIFMSEDDILEKYLHYWRKYKHGISLKISDKLITDNLRPGCSCSGCFGNCVRLADQYGLLPRFINHEQMMDERKFEIDKKN
jgi:hypothetical protein